MDCSNSTFASQRGPSAIEEQVVLESVLTASLSTNGTGCDTLSPQTRHDSGSESSGVSQAVRSSSTRAPPCQVNPCPICSSVFRDEASLWRHVNVEHIARREFPSADFFTHHGRLLCSEPTCSFAYATRWRTCRRAVGPSQRCSGLLVDPRLIISSRHLASYHDLAPVDVSDTGSDTQ